MINPDKIISRSISEKTTEEESGKFFVGKEPINFDTLKKMVQEWMLVVDPGILKLLPAVIISNRLKGHDPVWMFLIGPSGGGKTEFLNCLTDLNDVYFISLLTPNTFLSGMVGRADSSLLPKIDGKILIFKDWTNILSQNKESRNEIMGQLREIYDGYLKKSFGTGKTAEWRGKVGLIAGVTPAIDMSQQMHSTLGERFIHYRLRMPDRMEVARRALDNGCKQEDMRKALRSAFYLFMKGIKIPSPLPDIPNDAKEEIINVSNFATMSRSGVIREFGFKKEVVFVPAAEMPTRIVQQLTLLAVSMIIINDGRYEKDDMNIIYRVALDSIPQTNYMVMKQMARGKEQTTSDIATALGYPTGPIRMYLENLNLLGVCERIKGPNSEEGGSADRWNLLSEFVNILRKFENIEVLPETREPSLGSLEEDFNNNLF